MAIRAPAPEVLLEQHRRFQQLFSGGDDRPPEVSYVNVETLAAMYEDSPYVFDGRLYDVPPVSVPDGARVVALAARLEAMKGKHINEVSSELDRVFRQGVKLFKRLMKPRHVPRWFWRWCMRNPFTRMSEREFATALAFLALCRMRSRDGASSGREAALPTFR